MAFHLAAMPEVSVFTYAVRDSLSESVDISEGESRRVASCSEETTDLVSPSTLALAGVPGAAEGRVVLKSRYSLLT